jgi:hypothetical protein
MGTSSISRRHVVSSCVWLGRRRVAGSAAREVAKAGSFVVIDESHSLHVSLARGVKKEGLEEQAESLVIVRLCEDFLQSKEAQGGQDDMKGAYINRGRPDKLETVSLECGG